MIRGERLDSASNVNTYNTAPIFKRRNTTSLHQMQAEHEAPRPTKKERGRENRRRCDSRAAAWHNVFMFLVSWLGYDVVAQKPAKLKPKATLPRVPCSRISYHGHDFYNAHNSRMLFDQQAGAGSVPRDPKDFLIQEKSRAFNAALERIEEASKGNSAIRVIFSKRRQSKGSEKKRREMKPRLDAIRFGGIVFTKENVVDYGKAVYAWCCQVYAPWCKEVDVMLVPFPINWWLASTPLPAQEPEESQDATITAPPSSSSDVMDGTFITRVL